MIFWSHNDFLSNSIKVRWAKLRTHIIDSMLLCTPPKHEKAVNALMNVFINAFTAFFTFFLKLLLHLNLYN